MKKWEKPELEVLSVSLTMSGNHSDAAETKYNGKKYVGYGYVPSATMSVNS